MISDADNMKRSLITVKVNDILEKLFVQQSTMTRSNTEKETEMSIYLDHPKEDFLIFLCSASILWIESKWNSWTGKQIITVI